MILFSRVSTKLIKISSLFYLSTLSSLLLLFVKYECKGCEVVEDETFNCLALVAYNKQETNYTNLSVCFNNKTKVQILTLKLEGEHKKGLERARDDNELLQLFWRLLYYNLILGFLIYFFLPLIPSNTSVHFHFVFSFIRYIPLSISLTTFSISFSYHLPAPLYFPCDFFSIPFYSFYSTNFYLFSLFNSFI